MWYLRLVSSRSRDDAEISSLYVLRGNRGNSECRVERNDASFFLEYS